MKNLEDITKKLSGDKLKNLSARLGIKGTSTSKIGNALTNICNFNLLAKTFSPTELKLLKHIYSEHDGITLGELQKETSIELTAIEKSISELSDCLLVYVMKNRQLLNKRMDKIYCIKEIFNFFNISETQELKPHIENILETLTQTDSAPQKNKESKTNEILNFIAYNGNLVSLEKLTDSGIKGVEKAVADYYKSGRIKVNYVISEKLVTLLSISTEKLMETVMSLKKDELKKNYTVSNGFNALINVIHTYDIVSSSGLFLTKQGNFRKIDIKKISDRMISLKDFNGEEVPEETIAQFSMQILNILKGLWLEKDIGVVSLKHLSEKISNPLTLTKRIILALAEMKDHDVNFDNPVELPDHSDIKIVLPLIQKLQSSGYNQLHSAYMASLIQSKINQGYGKTEAQLWDNQFTKTVTLLTLLGLINIEKGQITISSQGEDLLYILKHRKQKPESEDIKKCIIINPDFTLMIDERDMTSKDLYTIQAFTEILSRDTIMQSAITKSSVIDANKRGMEIDDFISKLKKYAKNDLPQNLEFLLNDWKNQTIRIDISRSILVYSSHSIFLDELSYSPSSQMIKKRIADNYILIEKESIDDLVKFSKKFDVVINIFENTDE